MSDEPATGLEWPTVLIGVPSQGLMCSVTAMSIARTMRDYPGPIEIYHAKGSVLPDLRHEIVANGWEHKAHYIFWVDSDTGFPPFALEWMLKRDKKVVAANITRKCVPPVPCAYVETDDYVGPLYTELDDEGIAQVKHVGMGLMLTHMSVFDELSQDLPIFCFAPYDDGLRVIGEDVYFCQQCEKHGIEVFIDHDVSKLCTHIGTFGYGTRQALYGRNLKKQMSKSDFGFGIPDEELQPIKPNGNGEWMNPDEGLKPFA